MRILIVNHFPLSGSGSGVYTANLANALKRQGHEVAVVFPENRAVYDSFDGIRLYPVFFKDKDEIRGQLDFNFPCFTTHPRSVHAFSSMTEEEKEAYEEAFRQKIREAIAEFNPEVLHAQHLWVLAGIAAEEARRKGIPLVVTCHGTDLLGIREEMERDGHWGRRYSKTASDYAGWIIAISEQNKVLTESLFPEDKEKVILMKNGVDTTVFYRDPGLDRRTVLEKYGVPGDFKKAVCFAGKCTYIKGIDLLLKAAKVYEDEETATILAGDGELRQELEAFARDSGLRNVYFLGNRTHSELREIYNICDVSTVPSRSEAFGLVAAEAMVCGAPVVAARVGGLPELVREETGCLIEPEDYETLAADILAILRGEKAFDRAEIARIAVEHYSQDALISDVVELYRKAMGE